MQRDRIGLVGLSMGGEQAIGAAATNERVGAVVAEGATARIAADRATSAYGLRGELQERSTGPYGLAGLLTDARARFPARTVVGRHAGSDPGFLLITAGNVPDEALAAAHVRRAAPPASRPGPSPGPATPAGLAPRPTSGRNASSAS